MRSRLPLLLAAAALAAAQAQDRRTPIDVTHYKLDARIDPARSTLAATAVVTFLPLEDRASTATFELHQAINPTRVADAMDNPLNFTRTPDLGVRILFPQPLEKGKPASVTFTYTAQFTGKEDSPVPGLTFAAIQSDSAYLLYPARWFPVAGYTADRYTMDLRVTVPAGLRVVSSGIERSEAGAAGTAFLFQTPKPAFPGSLAVVSGAAQRVSSQGTQSDIWFRGARAAHAQAWGDETGKVMAFLGGLFGIPPVANLTLVETGEGAPSGYSAPGLLFLGSNAIAAQPAPRLLANQLTRQWFGGLFSAVNRNHVWITNGMAKYAELLYQEQLHGPAAFDSELADLYVDALTITDAPVRQADRFDDYSPEFFAVTGSKGAAVLNMLRGIMGAEKFQRLLRALPDQFAGASLATDDFRKAAEALHGESLQGFFIQWLESTGTPEFKLEYTVFRTQKGFRVMGKIAQDLDTFRMPVDLRIETEGNPEEKRVVVSGTSTEFVVDTFGKPKRVTVDPGGRVLRLNPQMRVKVAIRRGEQFTEIGELNEALKEFQKALEVNRGSSLAHYRVADVFFQQGNYQSAVNEYREALSGDLDPKWVEVWAHIGMGKIFDITEQRERATNEYQQAIRTKDNTQGAQEEAARYLREPFKRPERN